MLRHSIHAVLCWGRVFTLNGVLFAVKEVILSKKCQRFIVFAVKEVILSKKCERFMIFAVNRCLFSVKFRELFFGAFIFALTVF